MIFGIDLRVSPKRRSRLVALDGQSRLLFLSTFSDDTELFQMAQNHQPGVIAIGAPVSLPSGLCCLEISCECATIPPQKKGRQSELELTRLGIGCFFTNKRSVIRNLIYRGVALSSQLTSLGFQVIEVYPYATKVVLFGDKMPSKNSADSLIFMRERLAPLIQGLKPELDELDRNTCNAAFNAYTALLHSREATDMLGTAEEGLLVLPRLPR